MNPQLSGFPCHTVISQIADCIACFQVSMEVHGSQRFLRWSGVGLSDFGISHHRGSLCHRTSIRFSNSCDLSEFCSYGVCFIPKASSSDAFLQFRHGSCQRFSFPQFWESLLLEKLIALQSMQSFPFLRFSSEVSTMPMQFFPCGRTPFCDHSLYILYGLEICFSLAIARIRVFIS